MTADLDGKVNIWFKRDDYALPKGADTLASIRGVQSNHTRQAAAVAAKSGPIKSISYGKAKPVQEHWVDWADPVYDKVGNLQLSRLVGAEPRLDPSTFGIDYKPTAQSLTDEVTKAVSKPYYIPPAHLIILSEVSRGFARWAFEVAAQGKELGVFFDMIIVCAVTGSTFTGMIAGFKPSPRVTGIDAMAKPAETRAQILPITKNTAVITEDDVILDERYHAGLYGIPDKQTVEAIKYGARMDAFITDPVCEGKSLTGMIDLIRKGEISGGNVLYVHLGGQLMLNAYFGHEGEEIAVTVWILDEYNKLWKHLYLA
ncbi:tryptophan synthase beta subunit-like PLP-dependent enzyme [Dendrothele bispora CBS 962.96]|uniref:Tryptophan synthase beta subunit-like PLP-dependent enzyme n=1 Tax=Dendrothele bispora (strain CBS 962.96) TaxID=1314807 RepID=A0A4S8LXP7_DENBC|nr:tryptophan synthase beta subunit-like PLP-dependent enzyme [Dendrothele bispora CBS 962.96]